MAYCASDMCVLLYKLQYERQIKQSVEVEGVCLIMAMEMCNDCKERLREFGGLNKLCLRVNEMESEKYQCIDNCYKNDYQKCCPLYIKCEEACNKLEGMLKDVLNDMLEDMLEDDIIYVYPSKFGTAWVCTVVVPYEYDGPKRSLSGKKSGLNSAYCISFRLDDYSHNHSTNECCYWEDTGNQHEKRNFGYIQFVETNITGGKKRGGTPNFTPSVYDGRKWRFPGDKDTIITTSDGEKFRIGEVKPFAKFVESSLLYDPILLDGIELNGPLNVLDLCHCDGSLCEHRLKKLAEAFSKWVSDMEKKNYPCTLP